MGYTIKTKKQVKFFMLFTLLVSVGIFTTAVLPYVKKVLSTYVIPYYTYTPQHEIKSYVDTSRMTPAVAVPILMYHGVVHDKDQSNTYIEDFIQQMEMLKQNGYTTISVSELGLFKKGKFTLPPKPIVITFDDGRKDSYYTTDDIFKKLGFKATIFVATGPTLDGNSFYLTWEELKKMRETGRWEIEAHGRYSHKKVTITKDGGVQGRYLSSKMYLVQEDRIETTEEFKKRVEEDYINGINDLSGRLGIHADYFAIPLNDYGQRPVSNYDEAALFNHELIMKYFSLAFVQANDSDDVSRFVSPVYNFQDGSPYNLYRIEMKDMNAKDLKKKLDIDAPIPPALSLDKNNFRGVLYDPDFFIGATSSVSNGLKLSAKVQGENGQIIFGQPYWQDYQVTAHMERTSGRSIVLLFSFKDSKNYMSFGLTDSGYFLRSTMKGETQDIQMPYILDTPKNTTLEFKVITENGKVRCFVDGKVIYANIPTPLRRGAVGMKVWGDKEKGSGVLRSLYVEAL